MSTPPPENPLEDGAIVTERDQVNALMDSLTDHIYFKDRQSRFVRINESMAAAFGLNHPDEALGKTDFDFFTPEHAQSAYDDEQEILRTGQPVVAREEKETWPDGSITWVSTTKQCLRDHAGDVIGTFGISRDVTSHKRAERRLAVQYTITRVLAESGTFSEVASHILQEVGECLGWSVGAIWNVDSKTNVLRCIQIWHDKSVTIPEFEALTRRITFGPGVGLPGRVWTQAEAAWIEDVVIDRNFPRALVAREEGLHGAIGFPILIGSRVLGVIEFFSKRIEAPDEELLQMFSAVGTQIGQFIERKRMEETLAQKAAELERSNHELEQFAYIASHDLQEPLRMIASYTQLLERRYKDKLDDAAKEFIGFAVDGAVRMQGLISDLLTYSRVGTRSKKFIALEATDLVQTALKNLEIAIEESRAQISVSKPLPRVLGDATQLTQLFQNLIGNAIKFHGDKPPVIALTAEPAHLSSSDRPAEWHFKVQDQGIGIDPQFFDRIFVIFQRLHTRDEHPGTGIGLAVCKKIVDRHGGRIWVESDPGKGSCFHFTLHAA